MTARLEHGQRWTVSDADALGGAIHVDATAGQPITIDVTHDQLTIEGAALFAQALGQAAVVAAGTVAKAAPPHPEQTVVDTGVTAAVPGARRGPVGRPPDSNRSATSPAASPPIGGTAPPRAPSTGPSSPA